jgi:hypothetical protein
MRTSFWATAALVAGLLALQGHLGPAEAKRGGWGGHGHGFAMGMRMHSGPKFYRSAGSGHGFKGYSFRHHTFPRYAAFHYRRHHRFHHRRFVVIGFPSVYAYGSGYGCQWLKWKAIDTGSRYWWNRYYECIGYY